MTVKEAVEKVLKLSGKPLHIEEITERILNEGLWKTSGRTPIATVKARVATDIKHNDELSPFIRVAPRIYSLRELTTKIYTKKSRATRSTKTLSFTNAAEKILTMFGNKQPMHYGDITKRALELGLLNTEGKTLSSVTRSLQQSPFGSHERGTLIMSSDVIPK